MTNVAATARPQATMSCYDSQTQQWIPRIALSRALSGLGHIGAAVSTPGKLFILGTSQTTRNGGSLLKIIELNLRTLEAHEHDADTLPLRYRFSPTLNNDYLIIFGGKDDNGSKHLRSVFQLDTASGVVTAVKSSRSIHGRFGHVAVSTGREVIVWGGQVVDGNFVDDAKDGFIFYP